MANWHLKEFEWKRSPLDLYAKLYSNEHSFFLLSSLIPHENARFSYMSCDPKITFSAKKDQIILNQEGKIETLVGNPFDIFKGLIARSNINYRFDPKTLGENFFHGGAVGYWGYDMKDHIEKLFSSAQDNPKLPDAFWMFYEGVIVIDHLTGKQYFAGTEESIQGLEKTIYTKNTNVDTHEANFEYEISSLTTKEDYLKRISMVKEYIANGDVYEVNLTQRWNVKLKKKDFWTDFNIFKSLVKISPSPFSAFLKCREVSVISSSPERFLRIQGRDAESKPIKGTRPRSTDFFEDEAMYFDLLNSEKDRAENVMIVDLVRNDLGRVSATGSVSVKNLFNIEKYATVFQMVSTIQSKLDAHYGSIDAVRSCFPPGSMTGAPKISAMQLIEKLESFKRGIYSGALGYIGYDENMDLSVVIRTLILQGDNGYFQTGGAIVWDSVPEAEYLECLDKAQGIIKALERLRTN